MTYNWKLPAFFWLLLWKILRRLLLFCCLFIKGEVERPLQSRDCAGRVPLTLGHFIYRNFQADGLFWVSVFIFVVWFWFGKTSIFTVHVNWSAEKGALEWQPMDLCPYWVFLFSGTVRGKSFLEVRVGPCGREKCLLFGDRGTRKFHRISCNLLLDTALPGEPALLGPQDQTPCLHLSKHRGEKPQRKGRKFIYIYINIYII